MEGWEIISATNMCRRPADDNQFSVEKSICYLGQMVAIIKFQYEWVSYACHSINWAWWRKLFMYADKMEIVHEMLVVYHFTRGGRNCDRFNKFSWKLLVQKILSNFRYCWTFWYEIALLHLIVFEFTLISMMLENNEEFHKHTTNRIEYCW